MQHIRSMTGYGSAEANFDNWHIKVEISAINGKYADIKFKVPNGWHAKEPEWRSLLQKLIVRGTVFVNVSVSEIAGIDQQPKALVNRALFNSYASQIRSLTKDHDLDPSQLLPFIIGLPGVQQGLDEKTILLIEKETTNSISNAFNQFDKHRLAEGQALASQLAKNIAVIKSRAIRVESLENARNEALRNKVMEKAEEWKKSLALEEGRIEAEILFYLDKWDITEEKTRLNQHCIYFEQTLNEKNPGKKLGFISQEMGREINTLSNKANHFELQKLCVEMKEELEKIKEQLLNLI